MGHEGSVPHSQAHATWSYPEPEQSNPFLPILRLVDFNIILPSKARSSKWSTTIEFNVILMFYPGQSPTTKILIELNWTT